ncbi:hypothetical protein T459_35756 [Capsicum annuum]|uniref:Uncharacterized protein n=1 Tax=Capsicum annuum TaxID=4072 RepID=A0A2G2UWN8_CAPAN|nr:hypothetical protein T459_35756 [Capsicum annuum]
MAETKLSLISVQAESQNLAQLLQQQTQETATLLNQQAEQLEQLKAQSAQLNSMSQGIAETAKIKKTLFTSNIVLASIALILLISSIALGYVSKSKYNDINEMQNKVDYLKSQGGSMFTMECGGKLCVELDPNVKESYALDNGTRPLGIVREVR